MLRTRLLLNMLPFVGMLLATGVYAIVLFSRLATSVDTSVTEHHRSVVAAQQMTLALAEMDREVWAGMNTGGPDRKAFEEQRKVFEENLALQLKSTALPGENELNRRLAAQFEAFRAAVTRMGSLGKSESKQQVYDREILPGGLKMKALLGQILKLNQEAILATGGKVQVLTREVTRLMVIGMVIALGVSACAFYQLSRSVLRPINLLTHATRELGEGSLNQQVPVVSHDELGELALAFNQMAAQLREYRQSTSEEIVRLHRTMETPWLPFPTRSSF